MRFLHLYNHSFSTLTAIILFFSPKNLNERKWIRNAHTKTINVNLKKDWVFDLYILCLLDSDYHHMAL